MLVEFQAGEALNDITGVVFVLAAAALLVNGYAAGAPARRDAAVTARRIARGRWSSPGSPPGSRRG